MIDATMENKTAYRQPSWSGGTWVGGALTALIVIVAGFLVGWRCRHWLPQQRFELSAMRLAIESAAAPGELVVVDDRVLAWALTQRSGKALQPNLLAVSAHEPVGSLVRELDHSNRSELLLVASPSDPLVQALDASGFQVAQEVGWVPWDLRGDGRNLLGRGRARIFFVVRPQPSR